jgi:hypothetical protein
MCGCVTAACQKMKGFCITNSESIAENIHRILSEQLDYIEMQSEEEGEQVHKAIHEIRKSMKRIRAVLRLIRDEIGYSDYYRENVFYRDLSRKLSEIRNFEVLSGSIMVMKQDLSETIPATIFDSLLEELDRQQEEATGGQVRLVQLLKNTGREVKTGRKRIDDFPYIPPGEEVSSRRQEKSIPYPFARPEEENEVFLVPGRNPAIHLSGTDESLRHDP